MLNDALINPPVSECALINFLINRQYLIRGPYMVCLGVFSGIYYMQCKFLIDKIFIKLIDRFLSS